MDAFERKQYEHLAVHGVEAVEITAAVRRLTKELHRRPKHKEIIEYIQELLAYREIRRAQKRGEIKVEYTITDEGEKAKKIGKIVDKILKGGRG